MPKSVTVFLIDGALVITLCAALWPDEMVLAKTPSDAALVQELHREYWSSPAIRALQTEGACSAGLVFRDLLSSRGAGDSGFVVEKG